MESKTLLSIAEKYGTPLYVYDGDLIKQRYHDLFSYISHSRLKIYYAMKANSNISILKILEKEGACIDAVSPAEVLLALKVGFTPERILFTANNMTDAEIKEVHELGVLMNFESLVHLEKYGQLFPGSNVCVRLNPDVVAGYFDKIKTGGDLTKFGILLEEVPQIISIAKKYDLTIVGLHEHTGSGIMDSDSVLQSMKNILSVATKDNFPDLEFIDFGGGFGVPYKPDDPRIDYASFGTKITDLFTDFCKEYGKELDLLFEPGRFIVAESGTLVIQVNNVKNNKGRRIIGVNAGFPDLIRPMFYGAYHPIRNLSNPNGEMQTYDVVGNICETGDLFAEQRELPSIKIGDYLGIDVVGAYCYSMGGTYNMRSMPAEVVVEGGSDRLVRKQLSNKELVDQILSESK